MRAHARPMPLLPPVTSATFPLSPNFITELYTRFHGCRSLQHADHGTRTCGKPRRPRVPNSACISRRFAHHDTCGHAESRSRSKENVFLTQSPWGNSGTEAELWDQTGRSDPIVRPPSPNSPGFSPRCPEHWLVIHPVRFESNLLPSHFFAQPLFSEP